MALYRKSNLQNKVYTPLQNNFPSQPHFCSHYKYRDQQNFSNLVKFSTVLTSALISKLDLHFFVVLKVFSCIFFVTWTHWLIILLMLNEDHKEL